MILDRRGTHLAAGAASKVGQTAKARSGLRLAEGLAAAVAVYGKEFNGALSLKALTFFGDGDLPTLPSETQDRLRKAATAVDLRQLPLVTARSGLSQEE